MDLNLVLNLKAIVDDAGMVFPQEVVRV